MDISELIKKGTFQRLYRKNTTPASINPAIAFAMNQIAGLDENDKILDPCCGTGTILIERLLLKPALCIGVDIDPRQIENAKENIEEAGFRHSEQREEYILRSAQDDTYNGILLEHGNITEKKFPEGFFTKIISNLPYGLHSGSREKNVKLYHFLADISSTWLKKGGRIILLTSSKKLLKNSFDFNPKMKLVEEIEIPNDSLKRVIFIFERI
jgi:tRNA (guanine6-N2)-methyltransferase